MADDTLTPREVAGELGVTVRTVQRWIADGRLPALRVGGRLRLSRSSLGAVSAQGDAASPRDGRLRRVLIANRGEIAARIARATHSMGLELVAVHAPGDRPAADADAVVEIPAYLDGDA
ncbi:MAG TPA: excisionase family DNA-binding protein, partial [Candidatus Limnocylindria bacterium]